MSAKVNMLTRHVGRYGSGGVAVVRLSDGIPPGWIAITTPRCPSCGGPVGATDLGGWAVTVDEDPEFWLDAFEDRADAIRFCQEHGLSHQMEDR